MANTASVRAAKPIAVPRLGLLASASLVQGAGDGRWGMGTEWLPEMVNGTSDLFGARSMRCNTENVEPADAQIVEQAFPFQVYAIDQCTTLEDRDYVGRARRLLESTRSRSIAAEFWSGTIAQAEGFETDLWLASTSTKATSAALGPAKSLAKLDAAVAAALSNNRGMIHCTVEVLGRLLADSALHRDGNQWTTAFGNIVVADAGYTGDLDGEAGNTEWMIGSTMVEVHLGPMTVIDPDTEEGRRMAVVSSVNDMKVWAWQDAIIYHEPSVCLVAAQVDLS